MKVDYYLSPLFSTFHFRFRRFVIAVSLTRLARFRKYWDRKNRVIGLEIIPFSIYINYHDWDKGKK